MGIRTKYNVYYPMIVFTLLYLMGLFGAAFVIYQQKDVVNTDFTMAILIQLTAICIGAALAYMLKQTMLQTSHLRKEIFQRVTEMKEYIRVREDSENNNRLLNVVMDTLTQGICAFSPEMTLLKWNNNLESILGLPEDSVKEGILYKVFTKHLDQISYHVIEDETTNLHVVEDSFLKQDISCFERNLEDGRTLEISMTPMPDGGFVVVYSDITQRKKAERVIRHMAHFDSLTGLANRAYFTEKLEGYLNQKRRGDHTVALALIDLDKFKYVNDTYGHPIGDALLQRVSEILKSRVRDNDFVARIGGDEFAILFPNTSEIEEVVVPLNRMLDTLMKPIHIKGIKIKIGASIGISLYPRHATTAEDLIKAADDALYAVKENGRGSIEVAAKAHQKTRILAV